LIERVVLDTGPLGRLAHPRPAAGIQAWFTDLAAAGTIIAVPEVADYEIRRNLILHGLDASIAELDRLKFTLTYLPITTAVMRRAAGLWADARRRGRATAPDHALDCDVILAAQALEFDAMVATENVRHLSQFVNAFDWTR
jgi:predicted nucleic acid-binding protein